MKTNKSSLDTTDWTARRLLITGGGTGLGLALALAASAAGAKVAVVVRRHAKSPNGTSSATEDRLSQLRQAQPQLTVIEADVTDKHRVYAVAGEAVQALGGAVDILVNNASYLGQTPLRLLADSDCEDLEAAFVTNVLAPFRLSKALLPGMLLSGKGLILNISSDAAVSAYPGWGAYGASKAGLDHLARILDAEVAKHGVRSIAIDPGDMRTAMHFAALPGDDPASLADPAEVAQALLNFVPFIIARSESRYSANAWRSLLAEAEAL